MDDRRDEPTGDEGALDPDARFGQGTDASHPDSATGQPIERTEIDPDTRQPEGRTDDIGDA
ncbi:MAG: hypothetical protein H0W07_06480 [Chloroflexi bacterium]|nr:hypothetical protein [Chloroflexota bacterium]